MQDRTGIGIVLAAGVLLACRQGLAVSPHTVVINEIMASNSRTLADPQGQFDDWIELYNPTSSPVDVGGMFLTDDLSDPARWQIPDDQPSLTTIAPHASLLIWADGDVGAAGLHAGFSLSADGEEVGLIAPDGTVIDSVAFDRQIADVSYGRWPDGKDAWQYMATPTPRTANKQGYLGLVADVQVSPHRGFYSAPIDVTLTTSTAGAEIWYTLDAEVPHMNTGTWSGQRYTGPIRLSRTTCIRAVAFKQGWRDSEVTSHTYIFLDDVIRQPSNPAGFPTSWGSKTADYTMDQRVVDDPAYRSEIKDDLSSIPSVCIVIPRADFFGSKGIYSNPSRTFDPCERSACFAWIDPNTGDHFGANAGLRIQGAVGRGNIKKPLRVLFKGRYGPSKLDYPLFPDTEVQTFETLVLRSIWNYSWTGDSTACGGLGTSHADYLRDVFARDTIRDLGGLVAHGRPVHVYVNGLYWGLYIMTERPDDAFAAEYLGGDKEDYDVLKAPTEFSGSTMEVVSGDIQAWNALFGMADAGLATSQAYQAVQQYVDVPALIDYMLMIYYTGSRDAPVLLCNDQSPRNFYTLRRREPAGPFTFMAWDVEWALENPTVNRVGIVGAWNPHYLVSKLAANTEFKMLLADHIHRHFFNGGALTPESTTYRYMARADEIHGAIVGESSRWGDVLRTQPYTRADWQAEVDRLVTQYFSGRTQTVLDQLRTKGWYPSVDAPVFRIDGKDQYGGPARAGASLTLVNPKGAGTIYYSLEGSDPRVAGTGQVKASAVRYATAVTLRASTRVMARILNGSTWSALSDATYRVGPVAENLRITELMYHPADTGNPNAPGDPNREFIELTNIGTQSINLALVRFTHGIDFTFPPVDLTSNQYVVVVADLAAFQAAYGKVIKVAGAYVGSLGNDGDRIELQDPIGRVLADFRYCDDWFSQTDGGGYSLTVRDPKADPNGLSEVSHWRPSTHSGGSPGKAEAVSPIPGPGPVVIGEIMYHPPGHADAEYVELVNISTKAVALYDAGTHLAWRLTDGGSSGLQFTFPGPSAVLIQPGQVVLLVRDLAAFKTAFALPQGAVVFQWTKGSLSNGGDDLQLYSPVTTKAYLMVDQVRYSDGSHGRDFLDSRDPWPHAADGAGLALGRISLTGPGNDPRNWRAVQPSPGRR